MKLNGNQSSRRLEFGKNCSFLGKLDLALTIIETNCSISGIGMNTVSLMIWLLMH